jgi:two-component system NarL family sensor kinase
MTTQDGGRSSAPDGAEAALLQALELERRRLADALLNGTAQVLATVLVGLAAAGESDDLGEVRAALAEMRDIIRADLGRIQTLASSLQPSVLDDFGLRSALQVASQGLRGSAGPAVHIDLDHATLALPPLQRTLVFRTLEEAIRNAVQHAHARHIGVSAEETADRLCFRVEDDGEGFDVSRALAAPRPASGLQLMQAQVRALGGELEIDSRAGAGSRVVVQIPRGGADG